MTERKAREYVVAWAVDDPKGPRWLCTVHAMTLADAAKQAIRRYPLAPYTRLLVNDEPVLYRLPDLLRQSWPRHPAKRKGLTRAQRKNQSEYWRRYWLSKKEAYDKAHAESLAARRRATPRD